jgi:hypothetical protein
MADDPQLRNPEFLTSVASRESELPKRLKYTFGVLTAVEQQDEPPMHLVPLAKQLVAPSLFKHKSAVRAGSYAVVHAAVGLPSVAFCSFDESFVCCRSRSWFEGTWRAVSRKSSGCSFQTRRLNWHSKRSCVAACEACAALTCSCHCFSGLW